MDHQDNQKGNISIQPDTLAMWRRPGPRVWKRCGTAWPPSSPSAASASWGSPAASASWAPAASTPSATAPSGACAAPTPTSWWPGTWPAWWPRGPPRTPTTAGTWWRRCWPWPKTGPRATKLTDLAKLEPPGRGIRGGPGSPAPAQARELALAVMEEYGIKKGLSHFHPAPAAARLAKWQAGHRPPGHRLGDHRDAAPHPHGGGQRSRQSAAPGPARAPWPTAGAAP